MKYHLILDCVTGLLQLKEFDSFFAPGGRPALLFYYQRPLEGEEGKNGEWETNNNLCEADQYMRFTNGVSHA